MDVYTFKSKIFKVILMILEIYKCMYKNVGIKKNFNLKI